MRGLPNAGPSHAQGPSPVLIEIAKCLMATKAAEQRIRPRVIAYEAQILAKHEFRPAPEWGSALEKTVIHDRNLIYLLSAADATKFYAECEIARKRAGIDLAKPGSCPLLELQRLRAEAEAGLIEEIGRLPELASIAKQIAVASTDVRTKFIDLVVAWAAPHIEHAA